MRLIKPTKQYEQSWKNTIREFEEEGISGFWNLPKKPTDLDEYIELTEKNSRGEYVPNGWTVPTSTYWLIDNEEIVGHVNIRHELNERLEKRGGHIGYAIRPSARKKGYGIKILELGLLQAKELGLHRLLITCHDTNIPSQKIIERNGGIFSDEIVFEGERIQRYWVEV